MFWGYQNPSSSITISGDSRRSTIQTEENISKSQHLQLLGQLSIVLTAMPSCIVLSGLASHPMGSWQPHGDNKSFMWIRDELPQYLPTIRFILYGYDTTLSPSNSFQTIPD